MFQKVPSADTLYQLILFAELASHLHEHVFLSGFSDSVLHAPNDQLNGPKVYTLVKNVTDLLQSTFPKMRVFPVLGNHDVWPADEVPVTANDYFNQILSYSGWKSFLSDAAASTFKQGTF